MDGVHNSGTLIVMADPDLLGDNGIPTTDLQKDRILELVTKYNLSRREVARMAKVAVSTLNGMGNPRAWHPSTRILDKVVSAVSAYHLEQSGIPKSPLPRPSRASEPDS